MTPEMPPKKPAKGGKPEKGEKPAKGISKSGRIYVGIGGWTFEPWRGVFYPKGLPHAKELAYAGERLTSIEVNGTF